MTDNQLFYRFRANWAVIYEDPTEMDRETFAAEYLTTVDKITLIRGYGVKYHGFWRVFPVRALAEAYAETLEDD